MSGMITAQDAETGEIYSITLETDGGRPVFIRPADHPPVQSGFITVKRKMDVPDESPPFRIVDYTIGVEVFDGEVRFNFGKGTVTFPDGHIQVVPMADERKE